MCFPLTSDNADVLSDFKVRFWNVFGWIRAALGDGFDLPISSPCSISIIPENIRKRFVFSCFQDV